MFLQLQDVTKRYETRSEPLEVLTGVSLNLDKSEALSITGPSGSGKSTLLHLIGTLDNPTAGKIEIGGEDPFQLSEPDLARFRNETIGFVFQDHHLLPQYSVLENVLLPCLAFGSQPDDERARNLLKRVGLDHRLDHRPSELSGGERQRVAIARALINQPSLLLCDEPTGNLDQKTAGSIADLLFELHGEEESTMILVTHSPELAERCAIRKTFHERELVDGPA